MSKTPYTYSLFEGTFKTPVPVLDRSINLLMFRDPDNCEYQIVITRTSLGEEQTPERWCESEMEALRNKLPGFQIEGKLIKHEVGPAKLAVVQVANRYLHDGETIRQVQSVIKLPQHIHYNTEGRDVLIFTLNAKKEFTAHQRKHYVQVINTFMPWSLAAET